MRAEIYPLQVLLLTVSGWVHRYQANGIKPAPDRPSSWRSFLKAHWGQVAATDFFTAEVWTVGGLKTYYVLFFIDLKTRRVHIAGITPNPTDWFMGQAAVAARDYLRGFRYLIHDGDSKYSLRFRIVMEDAGISPIKTPYQVANAKAHASHCTSLVRFVRSLPVAA